MRQLSIRPFVRSRYAADGQRLAFDSEPLPCPWAINARIIMLNARRGYSIRIRLRVASLGFELGLALLHEISLWPDKRTLNHLSQQHFALTFKTSRRPTSTMQLRLYLAFRTWWTMQWKCTVECPKCCVKNAVNTVSLPVTLALPSETGLNLSACLTTHSHYSRRL